MDEAPQFVHHPTLKEDSPASGLLCFKDKERVCGADCMAWTLAPEGADYQDQQWANCRLLVDSFRIGKHTVITAAQLTEIAKHKKNEAADRMRHSQPAPPRVG